MLNRMALLLLPILILATTTLGIAAAHETEQEDGWEFTVSPYLWGAGVQGSSTVGDTRSSIDLDFDDIWDALELGAMVDFRAEQGRWAIQSNILWVDLEDDTHAGPIDLDLEIAL